MAHVTAGVIALVVLAFWAWQQRFRARGQPPSDARAVYWHFVDVVWLVVFTTVYLVPQQP